MGANSPMGVILRMITVTTAEHYFKLRPYAYVSTCQVALENKSWHIKFSRRVYLTFYISKHKQRETPGSRRALCGSMSEGFEKFVLCSMTCVM